MHAIILLLLYKFISLLFATQTALIKPSKWSEYVKCN